LPAEPQRLALDPTGERSLVERGPPPAGLVVAVGPEGGFGATDWRRLDAAGFSRTTLGPRVLRAETAALTAAAISQALWGDLRN
jgi:16S rRNA (uracil1498-N3)-methyltransferase